MAGVRLNSERATLARLTAVAWSVMAFVGCRSTAQSLAIEACHPFAHVAPEGTTLALPVVAPPTQMGSATLIGYVADSTSGTGVGGAVILLVAVDVKDTIVVQSDAVGRFTIDRIPLGRYRYTIRSVNFRQQRDSLEIRPGIDTLRVVITRGPPLCSVRLTQTLH